ncbi:probable acyl-CoA dehydrogenase 6 isoform X2 [Symsagittifera roscoffensis]|uniref:probable acyl-CoA dehydrogenase 6 isoform X2 n=1 Tax=Symsagittifera roscoffensis TaxID=84072 RepID=UPI00307C145A
MSSRITKFTSKFHFTTFVRTLSSTVTAKNADSSVPRPKPLPQASLEAEHIYTSQHVELRESYSKLIQKEIEPYIDEWEAKGIFPAHELFKKLGDAGFLGISKPVEYGGMGLEYSYEIAAAEELGKCSCGAIPMAIDPSVGTYGVQSDMSTPALANFGSPLLKEKFLSPSIKGEMVACIGVSEQGGGSDVANIVTTAKKKNGYYYITGNKMWITNGIQADWMCMLANTGPPSAPPHLNKSLICVPLDSEGVQRARKIEKLGMDSSDTAQIYFDNVKVPEENLIGEEGLGFVYQMMQFQEERIWGAASIVETLFRLISDTIQYTSERKTFGKPLIHNQYIHFRLAELETEVEMLRSSIYRCVGLYQQGYDVTKLASMVKLKAGRLSREVADTCLQFWGGMGYSRETHVNRAFRDLRLLSIGAGADEIMLQIICKYMGTLPMPPKKQLPSS